EVAEDVAERAVEVLRDDPREVAGVDVVQLVLAGLPLDVPPDVLRLRAGQAAEDPILPPAVRVRRDQPLLDQTSHRVRVELEAFAEDRVIAVGHLRIRLSQRWPLR